MQKKTPKKTKGGPKLPAGGIPTREEILDFIQQSQTKVGKREIARAFDIKGADRIPLKRLLLEMAEEGLLSGNKKSLRPARLAGPVAVLDIVARDADGDLLAEPCDVGWRGWRTSARVGAGGRRKTRRRRAGARRRRPHPRADRRGRSRRVHLRSAARSSGCRKRTPPPRWHLQETRSRGGRRDRARSTRRSCARGRVKPDRRGRGEERRSRALRRCAAGPASARRKRGSSKFSAIRRTSARSR